MPSFEEEMCELIKKCYPVTEAKVLTFYANCYYVLLLDCEMPLGIAVYYVYKNKSVNLHDFKTMEGALNVNLIQFLKEIENPLTKLWNEKQDNN